MATSLLGLNSPGTTVFTHRERRLSHGSRVCIITFHENANMCLVKHAVSLISPLSSHFGALEADGVEQKYLVVVVWDEEDEEGADGDGELGEVRVEVGGGLESHEGGERSVELGDVSDEHHRRLAVHRHLPKQRRVHLHLVRAVLGPKGGK